MILNRSFIKHLGLRTVATITMALITLPALASSSWQQKIVVLSRFDHEVHETKVFEARNITCTLCHNFKPDPQTRRLIPEPALSESAFKLPARELCHQCHQNPDPINSTAPKTCYTCHRSPENLKDIKPRNHANIGWATSHSTNARIDGDSCLKCHTTSNCVQCHQRRNDVQLRNHTRNYRFFHSVQARAQPHTCDSCHFKSFCTDCHEGR